jgi:hypothetical protein
MSSISTALDAHFQSDYLTYRFIELSEVHEFTFEQSNRRASQEAFDKLLGIFSTATTDQTMRLLLDFRKAGFMPLNNVVSQTQQWRKTVHIHPPTRVAILMMPNAAVALLQPILSLMRLGHLDSRMFQGDKYDAAMEWLKQG